MIRLNPQPACLAPWSRRLGNNGNQGSNGGVLARTDTNANTWTLLDLSLLTMGGIVLVLRNRRRLSLATTKR